MATGLLALAAALGAIVWEVVTQLGGRREAWDSELYWLAGYPVMLGACAVLGIVAPARPWRWPVAMFAGQAVWSAVSVSLKSGVPNLLVPGLVMVALLSLPAVGAAYLGAAAGSRHRRAG